MREAIGYSLWYFRMIPEGETKYDAAWEQFGSEEGFMHNKGMTTAERRSPYYNEGTYAWNGRGWPFMNSVAYKAYANFLRHYQPEDADLGDQRQLLYKHIGQLVTLHGNQRNIGEHYLPSSSTSFGGVQDYFHSSFPDILSEDLLGFTASHKDEFSLHPLLPEDKWDYFYLGNLRYRGHDVDIIWRKDWEPGEPGDQSRLYIWGDGERVAESDRLNHAVKVELPSAQH